jgi:4-amino-4-deoxy-L-arabinose transferase-like glycosyltransferase
MSTIETNTGNSSTCSSFARNKNNKTCILLLLAFTLLAVFVLFLHLGKYPFFDPDEALYAEPAREMLQLHEYVTTFLNYVVRYTKPPLIIWAMAACYKIFGVNEFAARFSCACSGVLLIATTFVFTARYWGNRIASLAALMLLSAPLFVGTAREAITDMPLSLFMAGALMAFFTAYKERNDFLKWSGYILTGLAVMTKGPVGAILPALILLVFHLLRGNFKSAFKFYQPLWGMFIVGLIALPWFAIEIWVTKGDYFRQFILVENFQRFTSVVDHKAPWWYHLAAIAVGLFPWAAFLPQAFFSPSKRFFAGSLKRLLHNLHNLDANDELLFYLMCWSLIVIAFFSASVSKLIPYTLPAFPALAILISVELNSIMRLDHKHKILYLGIPLLVIAIVYGAGSITALTILPRLMRDAPLQLCTIIGHYLEIQCALTCIALLLMTLQRSEISAVLFAISTFACSVYFWQTGLPVLSQNWQEPLPKFASLAGHSKLPIMVYRMRKPSITFYAGRRVAMVGNGEELKQSLARCQQAYVLSKSKFSTELTELHCKIVQDTGSFVLAQWKQETENSN